MLRRSPVFLFTSVASLARGIGAAVAILTAAHQLLWEPLPFPEEDRLAFVSEVEPSGAATGVALQNMLDFRESASFDAMPSYRRRTFGLRSGSERAVVVPVGLVTSDFFRALGTAPALGRSFTEEEARAEAPVIVLGHELFLSRFGGDTERLGETVLLNDQPRTIVGVVPNGFRFPMGTREPPIAYIPLSHCDYGNKRAVRTLSVVARLSNGISFEAAEGELGAIANSLSTLSRHERGLRRTRHPASGNPDEPEPRAVEPSCRGGTWHPPHRRHQHRKSLHGTLHCARARSRHPHGARR